MITGIIAEFNPFHNGHEYLIKKAKNDSEAVICVMSGNFVQRGDIAIYDKFTRASHALDCGADLVILLPVFWSMSCAENFAYGAVSLLKNTGIVDRITFGSEIGDINTLKEISSLRNDVDFNKKIKNYLNNGYTYAKSYELALTDVNSEYGKISAKPNNILGIEYISSANKLNYNVEFDTIGRVGVSHDSKNSCEKYMSASAIRELIRNNELELAKNYIPFTVYDDIKNKEFSDIKNIDRALLFYLRSKPAEYFKNLPDINEGLENRIYEKIKSAKLFEELISEVYTKRYTNAHVRRLLFSAAFGIDNHFFKKEPPYLKILGYNSKGRSLIGNIKAKASIPVVITAEDYLKLTDDAKRAFEIECFANNLYGMAFNTPFDCAGDLTNSVIRK